MRFVISMMTVCVLIFSGCATNQEMEDKELSALFKALTDKRSELKKQKKEQLQKQVKKLSIEKSGDDIFVSADLEYAPIPYVLNRILEESGVSYLFDNARPHGTVTSRFEKRPLQEALNLILEPIKFKVDNEDNVLTVRSRLFEESENPDAPYYAEVRMGNLEMESAKTLMEGLYPQGGDVGFGPVPESNVLYIKGPKAEVTKATQLLMKADQDVKHVMIEVLVVEYSRGDLEQLGTKVTNMKAGEYGNINVDFSSLGSAIQFSRELAEDGMGYANYLSTFTAAINILLSDNKARLISRPYISTMSGKEAKISIGNDRYLITDKETGAASIDPVTSGVQLSIVPVVLENSKLRMKVIVEDSQFISTASGDVASEKRKNSAETMMQVEDGQTIIIGGLVLNRQVNSNSGVPWLRNIPGINLLLADRENELLETEVSIFVTPHIWTPDIVPPISDPDALKSKDGDGLESFIKKYK